jgi:hypothetical protein
MNDGTSNEKPAPPAPAQAVPLAPPTYQQPGLAGLPNPNTPVTLRLMDVQLLMRQLRAMLSLRIPAGMPSDQMRACDREQEDGWATYNRVVIELDAAIRATKR